MTYSENEKKEVLAMFWETVKDRQITEHEKALVRTGYDLGRLIGFKEARNAINAAEDGIELDRAALDYKIKILMKIREALND